ncbi:DUF4362 domain-containing protein [Gracilibacillus xinjiangensis]|uniref:DUF4362 domain-containing protein n=1 Tax=Gracilibacillus xinjiangensis TaxID=1193282 RepID=A0ABV8WZI3_9BACI
MKYLFSVLLIFLVACGTSKLNDGTNHDQMNNNIPGENNSTMVGYIAEISDESVLVVEKSIQQPFEEIPIEETYVKAGNAIIFQLEKQESLDLFQIGEKVEVTYNALAESYPGQSTALDIKRVADEINDVIFYQARYENLIQLELFVQAIQNGMDKQIRVVHYTTEGDPVFKVYSYLNGQISVVVDRSQDQYGSEDNKISQFTCDQLEYYLTDDQMISFDLVGCDANEATSLLMAEIELSEMIIPEQIYTRVLVRAGDNVLFDTTDREEINGIVDKVRSSKAQSIAAITLMQPDGELVLSGKGANIVFDFYKAGNLVRMNSYLETDLSIK